MYYAIIGIVWFATLAMMVREGLWSNLITLAQIILSGLVAFGFFQPLATLIDERTDGELTYFVDYLAIWVLYCLTMLVLKILDQTLSKTRMKFPEAVDMAGGSVVGVVAGLVLASVVLASLHAAPMPPDFMDGKLIHKGTELDSKSSLTSLDLGWLRLVEQVSTAAALGGGEASFKARDYLDVYYQRRKTFSEVDGFKVDRSR